MPCVGSRKDKSCPRGNKECRMLNPCGPFCSGYHSKGGVRNGWAHCAQPLYPVQPSSPFVLGLPICKVKEMVRATALMASASAPPKQLFPDGADLFSQNMPGMFASLTVRTGQGSARAHIRAIFWLLYMPAICNINHIAIKCGGEW